MARDTLKLQYWTAHIKHWQTSGLAQRAYCVREGLKWPTFDYWRRQILAEPGAGQPSKKPSRRGLTLVPVRVADKQSNEAIVLRSPTGWELRLLPGGDPAWLAELLKHLS